MFIPFIPFTIYHKGYRLRWIPYDGSQFSFSALHYPFTEPTANPVFKKRWKNGNNIITGRITTTTIAILIVTAGGVYDCIPEKYCASLVMVSMLLFMFTSTY